MALEKSLGKSSESTFKVYLDGLFRLEEILSRLERFLRPTLVDGRARVLGETKTGTITSSAFPLACSFQLGPRALCCGPGEFKASRQLLVRSNHTCEKMAGSRDGQVSKTQCCLLRRVAALIGRQIQGRRVSEGAASRRAPLSNK